MRVKRNHHVGVIGLANAGKTVFLTSLLNHLWDHRPERFRIRSRRPGQTPPRLRDFRFTDGNGHEFEYERFRDDLVNGIWPRKTKDWSRRRCRFTLTDTPLSEFDFRFFDFPGERLADLLMATPDYGTWSDALLKNLRAEQGYRSCAEDFLNLQRHSHLEEGKVIESYKRALARLTLAFKPVISPSVFKLGRDGSQPDLRSHSAMLSEEQIESIAQERLSGCGRGQEFAPLDTETRQRFPALARELEQRYKQYRTEVVEPLFKELSRCTSLIVLIDVPTLLASGPATFNDYEELIARLTDYLAPGRRRFLRPLAAPLPHRWRPSAVGRICFAATKADLIHPDDMDRLEELTRELVYRVERDLRIPSLTKACAAVKSTEVASDHASLRAKPLRNAQGQLRSLSDPECEFPVSRLPESWPENWDGRDYSFPNVFPRLPALRHAAPQQDGLDKIFNFLLNRD